MLVEGQIVGGAVQGLGGALLEEFNYDAEGQLLTGSFQDYMLPTACEIPDVQIIHQHSPSPLNPLGVKGVGEGGPICAAGVIANAVCDALVGVQGRSSIHPGEAAADREVGGARAELRRRGASQPSATAIGDFNAPKLSRESWLGKDWRRKRNWDPTFSTAFQRGSA